MSIPSNLQTELNAFASTTGGTTGEPYTALINVLNNAPTLTSELSSDIQNGYLKGFTAAAPGNYGAFFNPTLQSTGFR